MSEAILEAQMKAIDKLYWTPSDRASSIHALFGDMRDYLKKQNVAEGRDPEWDVPSDFDLLCYAVEYMGSQAIVLGDEEFLLIAQHASRWLYSVHYSNPGRLWGEPDRREKDDVQESREKVSGDRGGRDSDGSPGNLEEDRQVQRNGTDDSEGDVFDGEDEERLDD